MLPKNHAQQQRNTPVMGKSQGFEVHSIGTSTTQKLRPAENSRNYKLG